MPKVPFNQNPLARNRAVKTSTPIFELQKAAFVQNPSPSPIRTNRYNNKQK